MAAVSLLKYMKIYSLSPEGYIIIRDSHNNLAALKIVHFYE